MYFKRLVLVAALALCGCGTLEIDIPPKKGIYVVQSPPPEYEVGYVVEVDYCYEEPYWWEPDWCDYYHDGTACCTWYIDGWYEEWCQWDGWCWEFNGYW